jgi:dTMP kinase
VLLDRYYISSAAYQGSRGAEPEAIMTAHEAFAPVPDLILLLDAPAAVGLDRIRRRGDTPNLFETEDALTAVRAIFLDVTRHRPHAARIDADRPWREVVREALARFTDAAAAKIARMHSGADAAERTAALLAEDVPPPPTH